MNINNITSKGLLMVVSGPSGAGKGTICKEFLKTHRNVYPSVSTTTRGPRKSEVEGINYHFISPASFQKLLDEDAFLEHAKVYGNMYGTTKDAVMSKINKGIDVLLEIEMQGARQVKEKYPNGIYIFILPPSLKDLEKRIQKRGSETPESMKNRLGAAYNEIGFIKEYNYYIINDEIDNAVEIINAIYIAEKCRINADIKYVIDKYREEKENA
ncbi:MAG: guanylate kinase [Peptostreptococcaceae bacterium]|nr:guanylate kinase [Peptostreptococcaceae bacterium]